VLEREGASRHTAWTERCIETEQEVEVKVKTVAHEQTQ